jgi:signal peptidase I
MKRFLDGMPKFIAGYTVTALIFLFGASSVILGFLVPAPSMKRTIMTGDRVEIP